MDGSVNCINWFEIAVSDFARAKKFYERVFDITIEEQEMMGMKMGFLPYEQGNGKVSGALVKSDMHTPSQDGAVLYMNGNPDLSVALGKVEAAGGKVIMPKTAITPEIGFMAFFIDSEGNRIGLHSRE